MKTILIFATMSITQVICAVAQNITGKVADDNGTPLSFINVVLLQSSDSTFIAGTITDDEGTFLFESQVKTPAILQLSAIGYATTTRSITSGGDLGTINMATQSVELGEVVVKSQRPVTAIKNNALVTTVAGSQLEHAGTANDVLTQVPMVLGRDGNFEVFGKGSPLIYINGRQVHDMNQLAQLNSADIKNIEVITNPGAKYDASVKSVIRINTKKPQGEGFSGDIRAQGAVQQGYFTNIDQGGLKYRTGGLDLFTNFGLITGKFASDRAGSIITRSSTLWDQRFRQQGYLHTNEFFGKLGGSYLFNERHSIGAYYNHSFVHWNTRHNGTNEIWADSSLREQLAAHSRGKDYNQPRHHANLYYNGTISQLGIDFNIDYMWRKISKESRTDETDMTSGNTSVVNSEGVNHGQSIAEKLVLSYPIWKGGLEWGQEYTSSRMSSRYTTSATVITGADSRVDENNIAAFIDLSQSFGPVEVCAGARYEHVRFSYLEDGQIKENRSKTYDNLFPSLSIATCLNDVQLCMSYTHKTQRPSYSSLDGTINYINSFTLEGGNPYLLPEKIHSVELTGAWRRFFAQLSYTHKKDPIMNTTRTYSDDASVKLITYDNFPRLNSLEAFVGSQFEVGIWQPKINAGIMKQWLTIDYGDTRKRLDSPIALVQFQNAIHLPCDIWLNANMQWMSAGNSDNTRQESTSSLDMKLYRAFFRNQFSVTIEACDIFNRSGRDVTLLNKDVTVQNLNIINNRRFYLTLQYTFNTTRDRYRGHHNGSEDMNRF